MVFIRIEAERKRSEESFEAVLFEAIEVDLERLGIGTCAETRFARFRGESVVVDGNIAQERNFPLFAWGKVDESLIIEVFRVVFALAFERTQQTRVSLETEAVKLTELFAALTHREASALQTERRRGLESFGFAIGNIEHRRHFVAIFGGKTAGREFHRAHQVGVDDAKAFLLTIADELRAINLYSVDVDTVFVVRTATNHVLRTHFVFRTDARHSGEHRLDAAARGIGSDATCGGIDGLHLARLAAYFGYLQVAEHILLLVEFGIDGEIAGGFDVSALHLLVADAREDNHESVGVGHREFVFTLIVGGSA